MGDETAVDLYAKLFYEMTKEEVEQASPVRFRQIIRKAFDNKHSGMGPGPTMEEVIQHYEDQANYLMVRGVTSTMAVHEALDNLIEMRSALSVGACPWRLPTIVDGSKRSHPVGSFDFRPYKDLFPESVALIKEDGWEF